MDTLRGDKPIREIEIELIKVQLEQMEKMAKLNPFSIHPILVYLEKKKYEVFNLRAIARGKGIKTSHRPDKRVPGDVEWRLQSLVTVSSSLGSGSPV